MSSLRTCPTRPGSTATGSVGFIVAEAPLADAFVLIRDANATGVTLASGRRPGGLLRSE